MTTDPYAAFRATCKSIGLSATETEKLIHMDQLGKAKNAARRAAAGGVDADAVAAARSVGQGRRRLREIQAGYL